MVGLILAKTSFWGHMGPKNTPITTHMNIKHWSKTPHYTSQELYFIQRCFQQYQMMHTTPTWYQ